MPRLAIDSHYLTDQLKALLAIASPTGYTDTVVRHVAKELERLGLKVELTRRGAISALRQGSRRASARAVVSHLDTLGAQVKRLKENGRVELVPIGNWSARFAEGARAQVFSDKGIYRGTILPLKASGHTFNDEIDTLPIGWQYVELRVDALSRDERELTKLGIEVGDTVAIDPQPEFLDNGYIVSRHLDDKAGVAVMLAAIEAMEREGAATPVDIHWLFTIAEEVGVGVAVPQPGRGGESLRPVGGVPRGVRHADPDLAPLDVDVHLWCVGVGPPGGRVDDVAPAAVHRHEQPGRHDGVRAVRGLARGVRAAEREGQTEQPGDVRRRLIVSPNGLGSSGSGSASMVLLV